MLLFSTKTKQIPLSFGLGGIKQMKTKHLFSFTTKPKQIAFTFLSAGTKQIKTNGILPFSTKTKENKWKKSWTKWALDRLSKLNI